jgi:FKBP-type peptidyl-prolyl cis-trans isomerase FklB
MNTSSRRCSVIALGTFITLLGAASQAYDTGAADQDAAPSADLAGYTYGVNFGQQLARLGITNEIPIDSLARGLRDGLAGKTTTTEDTRIVMRFVKAMNADIYARNESAAKEFLARNAAEKGVKKTASGLQYKVIVPGNLKAPSPKPDGAVVVRYQGRLLDGTQFDSSHEEGGAQLALTGVIKGWQEALPIMKPGAKWQLFIPPDLAYADHFKPGIPSGSLLIFDVELVSIVPSPAPPTAQAQ